MSNCVTHHACDCIMDKVIKYEKLQKELESVKAQLSTSERFRLEDAQSHLDELESVKAENAKIKDELSFWVCSPCKVIQEANKNLNAKLAAEKAKAKELLEALESIYNIDAKRPAHSYTSIDLLNDVYDVARQAIAKYKGASGDI